MKCISLTAPYGTLIALAEKYPELGKHIETRSWHTPFRGPLAIHQALGIASIGATKGLIHLCQSEPFRSVLSAVGYVRVSDLPRGAIVAVCELVDCVPTWADWATKEPYFIGERDGETWHVPPAGPERAFGDYTPGRYAWLLSNIRALPEPVPARGMPGLWNYEGAL